MTSSYMLGSTLYITSNLFCCHGQIGHSWGRALEQRGRDPARRDLRGKGGGLREYRRQTAEVCACCPESTKSGGVRLRYDIGSEKKSRPSCSLSSRNRISEQALVPSESEN